MKPIRMSLLNRVLGFSILPLSEILHSGNIQIVEIDTLVFARLVYQLENLYTVLDFELY